MGFVPSNGKTEQPEFQSQTGEKKQGLFNRLWRGIYNIDFSSTEVRWKTGFVVVASFFIMACFTGVALVASSSNWFCANVCHEINPEVVTFESSAHAEQSCISCHIPPGPTSFILHKMGAMKEMYVHFTGVPDQIKMKHDVPNDSCIRCHSENRLVTASGDIITNHDGHIEVEIPCVSCHAGVAHGKIVERGLNSESSKAYYGAENINKIMEPKSMAPNMGTCIDCHMEVNAGKEPWKEGHGKAADSHASILKTNKVYASGGEEEKKDDKHGEDKTQAFILQLLGKQTKDVELSMECKTCHMNITTPESHNRKKWQSQHGISAEKELNDCIDCHSDSLWIKELPKEQLHSLLEKVDTKALSTKPTMIEVKTDSRDNKFCSTCHGERPVTHGSDADWLTAHPQRTKTDRDIQACLVCHDYNKLENTNAPTEVYCKYCHRTGLDQIEKPTNKPVKTPESGSSSESQSGGH